MPPPNDAPTNDPLLAALAIIREQSSILTEIASGTVVTADRVAQILTAQTAQAPAIARIDAAAARTTKQDREDTAEQRARTGLYGAVSRTLTATTKGFQSANGQRLLYAVGACVLYWLDHHGFTLPSVGVTP